MADTYFFFIIWLFIHGTPKSAQELVQCVSMHSRSNWNLEVLVFLERGKPENPGKNLSEQGENQQQTQPTYDARTGNRNRATLVGEVLAPLRHLCSLYKTYYLGTGNGPVPNQIIRSLIIFCCHLAKFLRDQLIEKNYF